MTTQITLNGETQITTCTTLSQLVEQLNLVNKRFAVEVNENIIPKSRLAETPIHANDRIEIIQAVGGG